MGKTPFHYFPLGTIRGAVVTSALTAFYGALSSVRMTTELIRNRGAFFTVRDRFGPNRPKVLDKYGTHQFVHLKKQNIKLHYVSAGNQDRQLMLFVHGFPECWFSWRHQIEAFSADYHTVAVNMRGYGESDKPEGVANYSTDILVADVIELIQSLTTEKNQKCILVSHDWGGVVAWNVAQFRPDLVDRYIVLNAPHSKAWKYRLATSWKQFFSSWYMFFFNFPKLPEWNIRSNDFKMFDVFFGRYSKGPEEVDVYKHYFAQPYGITGPLNYYRAMLRGYGDGGSRNSKSSGALSTSRKVEPKTLIIWGRDDTALISELAQDSAQLCRDAKVEYLDKCSHWIQIHRPKEVNEIMKKFLKS